MRTDELIELMAADTTPSPRAAAQQRLGLVALAGAAVAFGLVLACLGLRPDLAQAVGGGFYWMKTSYTALLGLAGFWACERLARPGASAWGGWLLGAMVLAAFAALAVDQLSGLDRAGAITALRGASWTVCTRNILLLGAPMTAMALAVLRGLAPTRPTLAGFAAGAFSGGVAATVYGLHCPEATFLFVSVWYTAGVIASGVLGALLGRRLLQW
jgi:hypothetical protein